MPTAKLILRFKGGPGSGHRDHSGRPGKRGGSLPGKGGASDVEHARGVRAVRDLGGQVPQKLVNAADRTLQRAGLQPRTLHRKKVTKDDLKAYYHNNIPVTGDKWVLPDGTYIEAGNIRVGKVFTTEGKWVESDTDVTFHYVGKKKGHTFDIRI